MRKVLTAIAVALSVALIGVGCGGGEENEQLARQTLKEVARSQNQWTGVAVSKDGRTFVNFPRWSKDVPISVGEILETGEVTPYPDEEWNQWDSSAPAEYRFVCVQSVYVDNEDYLWILDPANPWFSGVVEGGPKLLQVDLSKNEIARVYLFPDSIAPHQSYLNDVRIDTKRRFAYITDSGLGALVILDLDSGESWRVLASDSTTKAQDIVLNIDGTPWLGPDSSKPQVHVDGIALDQDGTHIYYHALTARNLYRIETQWLRTVGFSDEDLAKKVEFVAETGGCDGMIFGEDGNLYLSAIEQNAVQRFTANKKLQVIVKDSLLDWPDSFSNAPDGFLYVTASQINIPPGKRGPYRLFKFKP